MAVMLLTGKLIDRQDFIRNLFNQSHFAIFALDCSLFLDSVIGALTVASCSVVISVDNTHISLVTW